MDQNTPHEPNSYTDFPQLPSPRQQPLHELRPRLDVKASWSLVLGIFSLFCLIVTAIPAIILGHLSLSSIKQHHGLLYGRGRAITGLVFGYLGIAVFIGLVCVTLVSMLSRYPDVAMDSLRMHYMRNDRPQDKPTAERHLQVFNEGLEANPDDALAYHDRAHLYMVLEEYDRALQDFGQAIRLLPTYAPHHFCRANLFISLGRYGEAISDLDQALALNQAEIDYLNSLAWLLATCPDPSFRDGPRAVELARKALSLLPEHEVRDTLAAAYACNGEFDKAVAEQEIALRLIRNDPEAATFIPDYEARLELYKQGKPYVEGPDLQIMPEIL